MATFVLVSGSWHAGWCFERIAPLLEANGHSVAAPDLLGMGPDETPLAKVTLAGWARQVADVVAAQAEPAILLGHSRGGIVVSAAAELVPERIRRLVYLAAMLVPSGESLHSYAATLKRDMPPPTMTLRDDGTSVVPEEAVGPHFYGTTAPEWVERAKSLLTPEPRTPLATPLELTPERFGSVPRAYIECLRDRAISPGMQRQMHAAMPCDPVVALDTDHSPFYSAPELLVEALEKIAAA